MATPKSTRLIRYAIYLFASLVGIKALYSLFRIITSTAPDFFHYYQAAQEVFQAVPHPIHLLPPFSMLILSPMYLVPYTLMQGIWVSVSFVCLLFSVYYIGSLAKIQNRNILLCVASLFYLSFPAQFTLGMGQINLIALFLLILSVMNEMKKRSWHAGGLFALAVLCKPELILLSPVVVFFARWQMSVGYILTLVGAFIVSVFVFGWGSYVSYMARMSSLIGGWHEMGIYYNQGLTGLVARLGYGPDIYMWSSCLVLGVTSYVFWMKKVKFSDAIWTAVPAFLLIEPIAWQHHFVFLAPLYIYVARRTRSYPLYLWLGISYVLVSWNFASPSFLDTMPLGGLVASHVTIGTLILWVIGLRSL